MKLLRSILKYLFFFALGAVVATFAVLTTVSYYAVEHLTAAHVAIPAATSSKKEKAAETTEPSSEPWLNKNIVEVLRFGDQYASELNEFDNLKNKISSHKSPPLCEVICSTSSFDSQRMLEERTPYLQNFYQQNGERSLKDPWFQLKLREVGFLSTLFPSAMRELWVDFEKTHSTAPTVSEKLSWSLKFEITALKELYRLSGSWESLKKESSRIQNYRELINSCQRGLRPAKDLRLECERL